MKTMVISTMPRPLLQPTLSGLDGGASAGIDTAIEYTYVEDELKQGVAEQDARSGPVSMGFRVPMIIASPWSRGGWVNSQLFDHTSTLMFLEQFVQTKYGKTVKEDNIRLSWRRAISGGSQHPVFRPSSAKEPAWISKPDNLLSASNRPATRKSHRTIENWMPCKLRHHHNPQLSRFTSHQANLAYARRVLCPTSYMRKAG